MQILTFHIDHRVENYRALSLTECPLCVGFAAAITLLPEHLHLFGGAVVLALFVHGHGLQKLVKLHLVVLKELLQQACLLELKSSLDRGSLILCQSLQLHHVLNLARGLISGLLGSIVLLA